MSLSYFSSYMISNGNISIGVTKTFTLEKNSVESIAKGEHCAVPVTVGPFQYFAWSFSSSNSLISINVYAMTPSSYQSYSTGGGYSASILSDGSKTSDSGAHELMNNQQTLTLYIVFANDDSDNQVTTLTYTAYVTYSMEYYEMIFMIIALIAIVIALSVVGVILLIRKLRNRESYAFSDFEKEEKKRDKVDVDEIEDLK